MNERKKETYICEMMRRENFQRFFLGFMCVLYDVEDVERVWVEMTIMVFFSLYSQRGKKKFYIYMYI